MKVSPMMQQYLDIKEQYKDCILFFRLGDFYEMFFDDALLASKELELTLTGKSCGQEERAPMCGVPFHAADSYIAKLVEKGHKVAICEQTEDPAQAKGIVKREVIQIVTPGTITSQSILSEKENNYLASVYAGSDAMSVAYCDISTGELYLTEYKGSDLYDVILNELVKINASEIILSQTFSEEYPTDEIKNITGAYINILGDAYFSEKSCEEIIKAQFNCISLTGLGLDFRPCAVPALGSLLNYLLETQKQTLKHLTHINIYEIGMHMALDKATIRNLEITETLYEKKIQGSLLGILDKTHTAMGSRKMRQWLREPLNNAKEINLRLDGVEELYNELIIRNNIKQNLKQIYDFERLAGRIACGNANGKDLIALRNSIAVLPEIKSDLGVLHSEIMQSIDSRICDLSAVYNIIEQKLAGLVASKIINAKEFNLPENAKSSSIKIPIYDVYFAMINNNILDRKHFEAEDAGETEKAVYAAYLEYKQGVYDRLTYELTEGATPYSKLSKEYQVYQSNIVSLLREEGVIMKELVDDNDATQTAWAKEEVISLKEYLQYCIAMNWIDVSKLDLNDKYSDSTEVYDKLLEYTINAIDHTTEFQKRFYKYMLLNDKITGKQICMLLCEQQVVDIPAEDEEALYSGKLSAYQFMMNRINNLEITPAQLALDPCNASVVITDVNTGDVLAMVSYPGYDNNKMANTVDAEYYAQLNADKSSPQLNFATQYKAAPGSTFKIVSATAGLLENVINLQSRVNCVGTFTEITPSPRCWKISGHGYENVTSAIKDSCNYFFYNVGYQLATRTGSYNEEAGLDTLSKYADLYGLTDKSGVEIGEYAPDVSTKDPVRSAIGQGSNSYTTVGLARYVTTIANSGTCYNLTLLDKTTDSQGNLLKEYHAGVRNQIDLPQEYWDAFHLGMRQVVENKKYFSDLAVNAAGKTGTAEQTASRPNHALFICYAPYENPEIAIATRIPFGYSSDYAAQFTRDIIKYYYGLAEEDDLITGTADTLDNAVSNEM